MVIQMGWLTTAVVVVIVCLLPGPFTLTHAAQLKAVCADLVGAGGVGVRVWPTIKASPERHANKMQFRLLQINWDAEEILEGDWLGVFEQDPRPPHARPPPTTPPSTTSHRFWQMPRPLYWDTPFSSRGTVTTNITQHRAELSVLARGGCVGVFVGFVRNGVCVAADCQAAYPTWVFDNRQVLGGRSLRSLVLPGTHNAGSYSLKDRGDVVSAWVVCQDEDIISQLLYGNRYLDLRVAYYPDTPELLWINHDLVRWRPLLEVLNDVRGFLAISPDPIIIDIHRTPIGFDLPEALPLLLSLMNETLGSHFLHNRYGPLVTLDQIWKIGKRVIFTFADADVADDKDWVWPPLPQAWANAQVLDDLMTYLDAQMNKRVGSPRLWAAMAHLTPTLWDMILRSHVGLRGLADRANFAITRWLRQRWGHMANIVASDFFRGNDVINVAIRTNLALTLCRPPQPRRQLIMPVKPQRHPVPFRRSTGFRIVTEPRRAGFYQTPTTTILPLFRSIYSPSRTSQDSSTRTLSPVSVTMHGVVTYDTHSYNTSGVDEKNLQPLSPTDSFLHPLIRVFAAPSNSPSLISSSNIDQDNGNRWSELADYPPLPAENEAHEVDSVSEPMVDYDTPNHQPTEDQRDTAGVKEVSQDSVSEPAHTGNYNVNDWHQSNNQSSEAGISTADKENDWQRNISQSFDTNTTSTVKAFVFENPSGNVDSLNSSDVSDNYPVVNEALGVVEYTHDKQTTQDTLTISPTTSSSGDTQHHPSFSPQMRDGEANHSEVEKYFTLSTVEDQYSTQSQTTENYFTQTQATENYTTQKQNYPTEERTKEHYPAQTQTTEHYPAQTKTTEHYPAQTQTTERYPAQTQTTEHYPAQTQTTEHYPAQTQTTEHYYPTQTTEHYPTQTTEHYPTQTQTTEHYPDTETRTLPTQHTVYRTLPYRHSHKNTTTEHTEHYKPLHTDTVYRTLPHRHSLQNTPYTETVYRTLPFTTTEHYATQTQSTEHYPTQTT
ncbi:uncharacterized protein LOC121876511 [Homarus americanus]|uniref:uncharacterized protein LOC121876511 n=1 Tax=Homarus americanus TaxID=6706 RepID=UPI001C456D56|nr:uncharacterized protein LOC121876511 [Homarus americanus]